MNEFRLYFRYMRLHTLSTLQYRGWFVTVFVVLFNVMTDPLDAMLMLDRFGGIGGMLPSQILLVYSIAVCAFGLAEFFGRGFDSFPWMVKGGEFDRILLRPRSTIVQTITLRFQLARLSRVVGMGALMIWCLRGQSAPFGPREAWLLISALAGGMLVYLGVFILTSALAFVTIEAIDLSYVFTNGSYQAAKVPPKLLPDWMRRMLTYIVPMFIFCYYPAAAICGWGEPEILAYLALPVGVVFVGLSLLVWEIGVRHYKSTGS